ncbi:hypothetical protein RHGRI_026661 [Rhododendron griersonianum]|uniref:Uncharacterized protein n=1 Tax=Rhododendron griersonianum TaxID=479676 RepID=A0AAV6IY07_9ERIC|nr:hypothetical protein RHGRI_026661 [Rhododendron griersonianum]
MYSSYSSSTATDMDYQKHSADPPQLRSGNPPVQTPPGTEAPWSTGLFSCFDDVPNCHLGRVPDGVKITWDPEDDRFG